ncbi:MAG TPA: DUF4836 family protein, partial [Flavisolibacter sp.]
MIPKDAAIAVHINSSSLSSKLSWKDIQATNWFKEMNKEADDSLARELMKDPKKSGIDNGEDMAFFMQKRGKGGIAVFEGSLNSASDFEKFNKEMNKENTDAKIEKSGDIKFFSSKETTVVAWNDDKFMVISDAPFGNEYNFEEGGSYESASFSTDSLKKFAKALFSGGSDISDDERFASMMKEEGDVHVWINSEYMYSSAGGMLSLMNMQNLMKGNVVSSTLNFDDGKITWSTRQYLGKEMAEVMKKYKPQNVNKDLINRIPSQNVIGALAWNYPSEGMKEMLKVMGVDGMANAVLGEVNSSLDELMSAYKGDVLVAVTDLTAKQQQETVEGTSYSYNSTKPDMKVLVAVSVKNKASFDKLIGIAEQKMIEKEGKMPEGIVYKTSNDWFAAGNSGEMVDKFLAGGNNNVAFASKISGHPFGMYIDLQKIINSSRSFGNTMFTAPYDISAKMWQDIVVTGGEFENGAWTSIMEINFVDKK